MSDELPSPRIKPVTYRTLAERHAHVALRLKERGGIDWTAAQVAALERKIKFVRNQLNLLKPVAPILPHKFAEAKQGIVHHYRVLVAGQPHTFIWSQHCRGLISYAGQGEIAPVPEESPVMTTPAPTPAP